MKIKLLSVSILLLLTITITIFSCRRESPILKETSNGESIESLVPISNIVIGCYDEVSEEGNLKYSSDVIDDFLIIMFDNGTIIMNSYLLKEFDSLTMQNNFFIISNYDDGFENGSLSIGLDIIDDEIIYNAAELKCTHKCIASGTCDCEIWGINDCYSHRCSKTCGENESGGCGQSIGTVTFNTNDGKAFLDQQTPEC